MRACMSRYLGDGAGAVDERHVLPQQLQSGAMYVLDRGYHSYPLYREILQAENSLVARLRCGRCADLRSRNDDQPKSKCLPK